MFVRPNMYYNYNMAVPGQFCVYPTGTLNRTSHYPHPETAICWMTVKQACKWIWQLGGFFKWNWADRLANSWSFIEKKIDGRKLVSFEVEDFKRINIIKKLGHRLAIIKVVKFEFEAFKTREWIMQQYTGNCVSYPVNGTLEINANGSLDEWDESSMMQQSEHAILRTQTAGVLSTDEHSLSRRPREEKQANILEYNTDQKEEMSVVVESDDMDRARSSIVVQAPIEKHKNTIVISDSDSEDENPPTSVKYRNTSTHSTSSNTSGSQVFPDQGQSGAKLVLKCNEENDQDVLFQKLHENFGKLEKIGTEQVDGKPTKYVIVSPDTKSAEQAFEDRHERSYSLEKSKDHEKWKKERTPMPSAGRPKIYIANERLPVTPGKSPR